jgi:hypothetical protein
MNRRRIGVGVVAVVAVLVLSGVVGATLGKTAGKSTSTASWTFALYVNGDNSLAKYWAQDSLPFLENVPPSTQVNVVALVSLKNATSDVVEKISGASVTIVETEPKLDMGIPSTVSWWINRSTTLFPSTYYALDIWDHGYGWKYVSVDDLSGHRLSMPQLQGAITASGKPIAILGFDACNMGNDEVVYQMAKTNLVSYFVGSEESVPFVGFPYDRMLTPLVNNPAMAPRDVSIAMVNGWGAYYASVPSANANNLAAYDVAAMKNSIGTFTTWTSNMLRMLPTYQHAYATALKHAYSAWQTHFYVDAVDYAAQLLSTSGVTDSALRAASQGLASAVSAYVVRVWNGAKMTMCGGVTFYFGTGADWSSSSVAYLQTAFASDTGWGTFLTAYNG